MCSAASLHYSAHRLYRTVYQYHYAMVRACYNINVKDSNPSSRGVSTVNCGFGYSQTVSHKAVRYKIVLSIPRTLLSWHDNSFPVARICPSLLILIGLSYYLLTKSPPPPPNSAVMVGVVLYPRGRHRALRWK
jgi:hypothetical protein